MRKLLTALCCVCLALLGGALLSGCFVFRAIGRSADSLVSSPRKVDNKLKDPVDKDARLAVLWIGHASALVQMDDKIILTDPVFTSSVGQLSKRIVEPGLDPANLPPVDAVMISHLHFDHLSLGSLDMIERKVRMLLMPPGGVNYLTDFSFPVIELRPWQAWEKDGLRVTATPVDHSGFRYGIDDAWVKDGFTGYVIEYHGLKVYFGGDTAYDQKNFVEVGERFPGIDLALLPIAPIEPHDFMRHIHMDPPEALQAFFDLGARRMVPIHYDTFINGGDEPGDALRKLAAAQKKYTIEPRQVVPVAIGERRVFLKKGETEPPWDPLKAKAPESKPEEKKPEPSKPAEKPAKTDDDDDLDLESKPKPADKKPADAKPTDAKPADKKQPEKKPADKTDKADKKKPGEKADKKPADKKPAEKKPADKKPADKKPEPKPKKEIPDEEKLD